jgi:hypothetical protein
MRQDSFDLAVWLNRHRINLSPFRHTSRHCSLASELTPPQFLLGIVHQ